MYIFGSIPFAYIITKMVKDIDIRFIGSGNPGTTNVFRTVGKVAGIITLGADVLKGFVPVYFATFIHRSSFYSIIIALVAIFGHIFTIFLKFKGGKGVAVGFGASLALAFLPSVIAFTVFCFVFVISGYVVLGSICAVITFPLLCYLLKYSRELMIFGFVMAAFVVYRHKANIKRLCKGVENRFKTLF